MITPRTRVLPWTAMKMYKKKESIHARSKFKAILQSRALADLVCRFESWTGAWARDAGDPAALVGLGCYMGSASSLMTAGGLERFYLTAKHR